MDDNESVIMVLRMNTGEDVIGDILHENVSELYIENPMEINLEADVRTGKNILLLNHWIPRSIVKNSGVRLRQTDIMFRMDPTDDIEEYYISSIKRMKEVLEASSREDKQTESMTEDEINTILLESVELTEGSKLH